MYWIMPLPKLRYLPAQLSTVEQSSTQKRNDSSRQHRRPNVEWIGVDGEGITIDGVHKYVLMGASNADGSFRRSMYEPEGIPYAQAMNFLMSLPRSPYQKVGFSLGYDWTMMFKELPLKKLEVLYQVRTDVEKLPNGRDGVPSATERRERSRSQQGNTVLHDGYSVGFRGQSVMIRQPLTDRKGITVWDSFKFFQCSFVKALELWEIGAPETLKRMKDERGNFSLDNIADIRKYCLEECSLLAQLMTKLLDACWDAGIELRSYHGAGSIANALLKSHDIHPRVFPASIEQWFMEAYYGGRFEVAQIGMIGT